MIQKIIKVGNSAAVTIPKEFMKKSGLSIGDEISMESNSAMKTLMVTPKYYADKPVLTPEFKQWLDKFVNTYKPVLKKLAHL